MTRLIATFGIYFLLLTSVTYGQNLSQYNVVWDTQSVNSGESMPCGGGDIGLNVWVEGADLLFYMSRSGAFDEINMFPKLGRIRVKLFPNPFADTTLFRQELKLKEGYVEISGKGTKIKVWVDVFRPVIHVESESKEAVKAEVYYENWRLADLPWTTINQYKASRGYLGAPDYIEKPIVRADSVNFDGNRVVWYHRNRDQSLFDITVAAEGLDSVKDQMWNPLKNLTFGGSMKGDNMQRAAVTTGKYADIDYKAWGLESVKPARKHHVKIALHIDNVPTLAIWENDLKKIETESRSEEKTAHAKSIAWWNEFWTRSFIIINSDNPDPVSKPWQVGRNYQIFRYQLGCNARGKYPTKFNGGLFTYDPCYVDSSYAGITPDHRNWGGGTHTAQNQRLVYYPMIKSGDFDMLKPQIDFYLNMMGNAELRSKVYWGHGGACFAEQIEQFGLPVVFEYGWNRPSGFPAGVDYNRWLEYSWDTVLEFCLMALDVQQYSGMDISRYIPLIESSLEFFFQHYEYQADSRSAARYDQNGKLVIYPGSAAETYKMAYNPSSTIAGLHTIISRVVELPEEYISAEKRTYWSDQLQKVPPIPFREMNGFKTIAPAETFARLNNTEIPQLYPVYPYGMYGVGKPDLDVAINTWRHGVDREDQRNYISWHQDAIFCARLGLTEEATALTIKKMEDSGMRFPTWWGPGQDWVPDHNWGGSGMIGVQEMLMQTDHEKIYLFPAWDLSWDVQFKLHAPYNTTIEGELKGGKLINLKTTPESRKKDVVISDIL